MKYMLYGKNYNLLGLLKEYNIIIKMMDDSCIITLKRVVKDTIKLKLN